MTSVPAARSRVILKEIAPVAWEHPADRAALQALRAVPGFDEVVKKIVGFFGERGIRLLFQANAVRTGPTQFPVLHTLMTEACTTMDWPERPELYVTQTPLVNAGAVGMDRPFIILNSGAVSLLNHDELRVLISHELGHVISGHALYRTVLVLILTIGFQNLPFLAGLVLLPVQLALLEWSRKSELSADRAGLLGSQDPDSAMRVFLKLAGGGSPDMDLKAFMDQAREYEAQGGAVDMVYKILNTLGATHPFNTLRAAELERWIAAGDYDKIIKGEYPRRGSQQDQRPLANDIADAAGHYAREAKKTAGSVVDAAKKAAQAVSDAFKDATKR